MSHFNLAAVRQQFPIVEDCIYLNHAAVSPISRRVQAAISEQATLHMLTADGAGGIAHPAYQRGRALAAALINGAPSRIAYIQNTSHGLSQIANGLPWHEGDNVVLNSMEFPSNYLTWTKLAASGVEVRLVDVPDRKFTVDKLRPHVDGRTRVVAVSQVQYYSGYQVDLAAFGQLCHEHNALLVVDGTQSIGAVQLDMASSGVDALVVSAHKWMLGPLGIGFMAFSEAAFSQIDVSIMGWLSVAEPFAFRREHDYLPDGGRFEPGTENAPGRFGLVARLEEITETGADVIEARVLALTDYLCEALESGGFRITTHRGAQEKSGIVTYTHDSIPSQTMYERLGNANIKASLRSGAIRISPHYYNSEAEIDQVITASLGK